jgi:hypothetical protein
MLKICAYVKAFKETYDVEKVDFQNRVVVVNTQKFIGKDDKVHKAMNSTSEHFLFEDVYICHCDNNKMCQRRTELIEA